MHQYQYKIIMIPLKCHYHGTYGDCMMSQLYGSQTIRRSQMNSSLEFWIFYFWQGFLDFGLRTSFTVVGDSWFTWIHKMTVMIHFNLIHFFGYSKKTWFPIPNYISIDVNDSTHDSFRAMANWKRFNSISIHSCASMQNAANTPFCTFASTQLQSSQLFYVAGISESCIDFQWEE